MNDENENFKGILSSGGVITECKLGDNILRESALRLESIIEGTCAGTWEWNIQTGETVFNQLWAEIAGYTLDELAPVSIKTWEALAHPDDLKQSEELLTKHFAGELPYYHFESRMKHKDGHWIWVLDRGKVSTWSADGKPLMMYGTHADISNRKLAEFEIRSLLAEKELILKEVHHRLKNNMNTVKGLLSLQIDFLKDPGAISALQDTIRRVDSMSVLYDKLYLSHNFCDISVLTYLPFLIDEIIANFPGSEFVRVEKKIDDFVLEVKTLQPLGIIINELLTNIMKYAFTARDNNLITVSATLTEQKVSIIISDNGNGIPESVTFENSTGFGMQLVGMLTEQIDGKINIERENGTRFVLEFEV